MFHFLNTPTPLGRLIATYRVGTLNVVEDAHVGQDRLDTLRNAAKVSDDRILLSASVYDAAGRLTDSYDARGFRTQYKYDVAGRRTHERIGRCQA